MATVLSTPNQRVVMDDISWETYEQLLADFAESSGYRLSYDGGTLEIMSPLEEHEESNRTLNLLVEAVAEEREIEIRNLSGSQDESLHSRQGRYARDTEVHHARLPPDSGTATPART